MLGNGKVVAPQRQYGKECFTAANGKVNAPAMVKSMLRRQMAKSMLPRQMVKSMLRGKWKVNAPGKW
ncbi:hypothetical protein [Candidatus Epulonipiscium viviparus]|uniref:hypothetical protein n=1 Tax=Candidatus Epulonipiscium viviparus TaxID=420336 RepID=UPI0027381669|nr:hypothetical protein [Candidatus Epulopiscium viviparus]